MASRSKWQAFVSLDWYDAAIEFVFRFAAKTSEPLLAAGVVVSSVDFLQHGQLMTQHRDLMVAWTWAQGLAIETSGGVMLAYGLQARKSGDAIKTWLNCILATLLLLVGAILLGMEFYATIKGVSEASSPDWYVIGMSGLRSLVSIGYVALCRTKHLRYSGEESDQDATIVPPAIDVQKIIEELDQRSAARMQTTIEVITQRITETVVERVSVPQLPPAHQQTPMMIEASTTNEGDTRDRIQAVLAESPGLSSRKIAERLGDVSHTTVATHIKAMKLESEG